MDLMGPQDRLALPGRRALQATLENKEIRARRQTPARLAPLARLDAQATLVPLAALATLAQLAPLAAQATLVPLAALATLVLLEALATLARL